VQLNHYTCGQGFPIVILHGLFGSSDNWQTLSKQFKDHYTVFTLDLRNHGNSPHDDLFNYDVMAGDLREFADVQKLSEFFLLGHSMGGKVAMRFAAQFPERVRKLIVADIAPKAYPPHHLPILEAMTSVNLSQYTTRSEVDRALMGHIPDIAVRQFLLKSVERDSSGHMKWKIHIHALRDHYDDIAGAPGLERPFENPTLFIRGGNSDYINPHDEPEIRRQFPRATIKTIEGAGHWLHAEKPAEFFALCRDFLQQ